MNKFEVGDKAIVIGKPPEWTPPWPDYTGQIVTIIEPLQSAYNGVSGRLALVYVTDIPAIEAGTMIAFEPHDLKPIDGDEEASWEQVEEITDWRPKELVHVETNS